MSELEKFLQDQSIDEPDESGTFTFEHEDMLKSSKSLLPDSRFGLLFFFQAAERWEAELVDVKFQEMKIKILVHLRPESVSVLTDLLERTSMKQIWLYLNASNRRRLG